MLLTRRGDLATIARKAFLENFELGLGCKAQPRPVSMIASMLTNVRVATTWRKEQEAYSFAYWSVCDIAQTFQD